jgi:hypothetical protein
MRSDLFASASAAAVSCRLTRPITANANAELSIRTPVLVGSVQASAIKPSRFTVWTKLDNHLRTKRTDTHTCPVPP